MTTGSEWKKLKLGDVCAIEKEQDAHSGLPYVGLEHIQSDSGRFIGSLEPATVKSSTFRFSPQHLLYGRLRPYLNKVLAPEFAGHCSTEIFPIRPKPFLLRQFLRYWFLQHETVAKIDATSTGARMPRANMNAVLGFEFRLPPLGEQQRIVGILDKAFAAISAAKANTEKNLQNARAAFDNHLASVFSRQGEGWIDSTVGEHIHFIDYRGRTPEKTKSGLRLITAKNVRPGYLQDEPREFVAPETYKKWMTRGIPKRGDVLFTTEAPLAYVAQLDTDEKVVFAQRIIIMQPDPTKIDSAFLKYMLLSDPIQQRIRTKGTGATVQGIKARLLKTVSISFPQSLSCQRQIVSKLDDIRDETLRLESTYTRKLVALDELKKSLLHEAFNGRL